MQFLYLIKCQQFVKIGVANHVESRLAQLSTGNPFPLEVLAVYGFDDAEIAERAIHQRFANSRKRGEWFDLGNTAEADFREVCKVLGGEIQDSHQRISDEMIEEADEMAIPTEGGKWDYAAMFADGWRIAEQGRSSKYWNWRRGSGNKETIYGGRIEDLPYSIENIRRMYRDGLPVIPVTSIEETE